jgi:two-component system sensor histidine kinase MtrB
MRLERVVGNLLENAVFHGGGRSVRIDLDQVDDEALISVVDQGPGIDPEKLPRIFDRFWRGDISRQRDGRIGSGLGLSIARENALIIGAQIEVQSLPGEGARFDVRIPTGAA